MKEREIERIEANDREEREVNLAGSDLAPLGDEEQYEMIERLDDKAIVEMMTGQAIQDYVYAFRQGGRLVVGLTIAGINEAANRRGGIRVEEIQYEERENSWLVIVKAVDTYTGSARYGACEQPKKINGKEDPFAFTKAVHKAQRNAIKQLLPVPIIKEVINYYLQKKGISLEEAAVQRPQPKADKISNAQKAAFATYHRLRPKLEKEGISQEDFWGYVKKRYGVESRNDMTERQWVKLAAELKAAEESELLFKDMVERVKQSMAAEKLFGGEEVEAELLPPEEAERITGKQQPQPAQTRETPQPQPSQPKKERPKRESKLDLKDTLFQI